MNSTNNNDNSISVVVFFIKFILTIILIAGILYSAFWVVIVGAFTGQRVVAVSGLAYPILVIPLLIISLFVSRIRRKVKLYLWMTTFIILIIPTIIKQFYDWRIQLRSATV